MLWCTITDGESRHFCCCAHLTGVKRLQNKQFALIELWNGDFGSSEPLGEVRKESKHQDPDGDRPQVTIVSCCWHTG